MEVLQPRCIPIVRAESSDRERLEPATYQVGKQTQLLFTLNMYLARPRAEGTIVRRGHRISGQGFPLRLGENDKSDTARAP